MARSYAPLKFTPVQRVAAWAAARGWRGRAPRRGIRPVHAAILRYGQRIGRGPSQRRPGRAEAACRQRPRPRSTTRRRWLPFLTPNPYPYPNQAAGRADHPVLYKQSIYARAMQARAPRWSRQSPVGCTGCLLATANYYVSSVYEQVEGNATKVQTFRYSNALRL